MEIEVNGVRYSRFTGANATLRLDALSNSFSFGAVSDQGAPLPFTGGEACTVYADGEKVVQGFIELVNVSYDASSHAIDLQGRDKTGDLVDSSIGVLDDLGTQISLRRLTQIVIAHLNPRDPTFINVVDLAKPALFTPGEDLAAPDPGQNAFEFLETLARKRQVLLTSNADGDVVITQNSGTEVEGAAIIARAGDPEGRNNVIKASVSYDQTGRFNVYKIASQDNLIPLAVAGSIGVDQIVDQGGSTVVLDQAVRRGRQFILTGESSFAGTQTKDRATWEANIRKARGRVYSATVHGFRHQGGALWSPNTLVRVQDDRAGINAKMLINSVNYAMDTDGGRMTTLSLLQRDAYTLELEEPGTEEDIGFGLF